jgi:hypothetical protein
VLLGTVQFHIRLVRGVFRFLDKVSSEHLKKVTTKRRIEVEVNGRRTGHDREAADGGERLRKGENETRRWESRVRVRFVFRVNIHRRVRRNLATTLPWEPIMDPPAVVRLVEWMALGEG